MAHQRSASPEEFHRVQIALARAGGEFGKQGAVYAPGYRLGRRAGRAEPRAGLSILDEGGGPSLDPAGGPFSNSAGL